MKEKLRNALKRQGITQNELAEILGLTYQTISIKMNGHKDFTQSEIKAIMIVLGLTPEEVVDIFLSNNQ